MNYLLAKSTVCALGQVLEKGDSLFYKDEDIPQYILDFFESNGFHCEKRENRPSVYQNHFGRLKEDTWISKEELLGLDLFRKKYYIDNYNFGYILSIANSDSVFFYGEELDTDILNYLSKINNKVQYIPFTEKPPKDGIFIIKKYEDSFELNEGAEILHYTNDIRHTTRIYRRFKLNDFLKERFIVDTVHAGNSPFNKNYKTIIVSDARSWFIPLYMYKENGTKIIYDRTDDWTALNNRNKSSENELFNLADLITCSSRSLYESLPDFAKKKAKIIYNGTKVREYTPVEKFSKKTAVYAGCSPLKIDFNVLKKLANKNPDWNINIYGVGNIKYQEMPSNVSFFAFVDEDTLFRILCKSHIGLIPFLGNPWDKGMLPLKLFNYANAHIPTVFWNSENCKDFPEIAIEASSWDLDTYLNTEMDYDSVLASCDWEKRLDEWFSYAKQLLPD